jgi:hypothetical protein
MLAVLRAWSLQGWRSLRPGEPELPNTYFAQHAVCAPLLMDDMAKIGRGFVVGAR